LDYFVIRRYQVTTMTESLFAAYAYIPLVIASDVWFLSSKCCCCCCNWTGRIAAPTTTTGELSQDTDAILIGLAQDAISVSNLYSLHLLIFSSSATLLLSSSSSTKFLTWPK